MKPNSDDRDGTQQAAGWVTDAHSPLPPGLPRPEQTNEQLQTSHNLSPLPPGLSRSEQTNEQLPNLALFPH